MEYTFNTSVTTAIFLAVAVAMAWLMAKIRFIPHLADSTTRNEAIDGIRGLSAIFIFVNHAPFSFTNMGITNSNFSTWGWIYPNLGSLGVQMFFCITGFLFFDRIIKRNGAIDWKAFYISRIRRIIPMYAFVSLVVLAIALLFTKERIGINKDILAVIGSVITFNLIDSKMIIWGIKLAPLNSVTWTLLHEWRFYWVLPGIAALFMARRFGIAFLFLTILVAVIDFYVSDIVVWAYFVTGIATALVLGRLEQLPKYAKWAITMICLALFIYTCGAKIELGYGWVRYLCSSFLFVGLMASTPSILKLMPLKYLGEISYSVYLIHLPVIYLLITAVGHITQLESLSYVQFFAILTFACCLTVLVSSFTFKYIEHPFISKRLPEVSLGNGSKTSPSASIL